MLGYPVTPNYYWSIHNGNQIQIPLIQIAFTYANTCKPVSDEIRTLWHKLHRLRCYHLEEILMDETISIKLHDSMINEIFHLRNITLARLRDLLEKGEVEKALEVISFYKLDEY